MAELSPTRAVESSQSYGWVLLPLACIAAVFAVVPAGLSLALENWNSGQGAYGAGWLMVALFAYVIWEERESLAPKGVAFEKTGLILVGVALALVWLAQERGSVTLSCAAAIVAAAAGFVTAYGWTAGLRILAPLALLALALPMWSWLREPLQFVAASVVASALSLTGMSVFIQGTFISVPAGTFAVETGCSGLNYLLVSTSLATTAGLLARRSTTKLAGIVLGAAAFAVAINWLRIALIIVVGNATQMQSPLVTDHVTFGWLLFSIAFIPYCLFVLPRPAAR
ncbi:MAG: exosortase [Pseudomonadaceae bacterium]|nr:exosortase [Pseudomonadaceae bacterium]